MQKTTHAFGLAPDKESLKQRIHRKEVIKVAGTSVNVSKSQLEDILSKDDYDLVGVDSQHSAFNEEKLVAFCGIAEELGMPVQLRIKHTRHAYLIGNYLDLGPFAIVVPQVEEESTVLEAIDAFYYPPMGKRSWGGAARYGLKERSDRLEYSQWWNDNGILILQIESVNAVTNARKLAKPGVDMLVFGAMDLSFSLESYPEHPFKTVEDCIRHVQKQMEGTQVKVGVGNSPAGR
jgi:4-hydroxy-2-oxoheptanedioate aldolase